MCDFLTADWNKIAAIIAACATIVMAVFAILAWRLQKQLTWLTGALESQATIQIRLLAEKENKPVVWWDPTLKGGCRKEWPEQPKHRDDASVETVYVGLPRHLRKKPRL
jgi:hypothetical protein